MMTIILISFVTLGVLVYEARYLIRRRLWGELATVIVLIAIGFMLAAGPALGITLPKLPKLIAAATNGLLLLLGIPLESR